MLIRQIIINASPLIVLFKSQQAYFLPQLFEEILVPAGVWQEISSKPNDIAARQLQKVTWVKLIDNISLSPIVIAWNLGLGESEVLSLASQLPGYGVAIDDRAARRCAKTLKIPTLGTGAILILAKQAGLIEKIKPGIQALQEAGLYLSNNLVSLLLQKAGE